MRTITIVFILAILFASCTFAVKEEVPSSQLPLEGTWKLLSATLIERGDTVVRDYTGDISFIKVINDTHFAFLQHDINKGKDSSDVFAAGGGSYTLKDSLYTELLEYCSAREWEGHTFEFVVTIQNDTLVQSGVEKIEDAGIDRINIEKYIRKKG